MGRATQNRIVAIFLFFAALYIALALVGAARSYSPVPLADMWDGYLYFYVHATQGDLSMWWAQHNEHRIALSRILFWIDLGIFHGNGIFLIVANFALAALASLVLFACLDKTLEDVQDKFSRNLLGIFVVALLFSWLQKDNFAWGFQSQFFLAQLVPLGAFLLLHKSSASPTHSSRWFAAACVCGIAALGSMANGVLALPLMCVLAVALRMDWRRIVLLAVLAVAGSAAYFYDYHAPGAHGSLTDAMLHQPVQLLKYLLLYLGNPFFYATGKGSRPIAELAGLFLIGSAVRFAWRAFRPNDASASRRSLQLALLTFLLYIGGTALGTAGGRLVFGIDQAVSGRYTTPTLMAWSVLLILYSPVLARRLQMRAWPNAWPFLLVLVLLLPFQLRAFESHAGELFERKVGVLAAELGIRDQPQIAAIYPSVEGPISRIKEAAPRNLTIFGDPYFRDAIELVGTRQAPRTLPRCTGRVDSVDAIENETRYVRINGWLAAPEQKTAPQRVQILDRTGLVVGYAFVGQVRGEALDAAFKGYVLAQSAGQPLVLQGVHPDCQLQVEVPQPYFQLMPAPFGPDPAVVSSAAVAGPHDWHGSDVQKTAVAGYAVFGSQMRGDSDTGSIVLNLKRGDVVYYRSGPAAGRQLLEVAGGARHPLPHAENWVALAFSNAALPAAFTVKFTDNGDRWGEWSAIAVKN